MYLRKSLSKFGSGIRKREEQGATLLRGTLPISIARSILIFLLAPITFSLSAAAQPFECSISVEQTEAVISRGDGKKILGRTEWTEAELTSRLKKLRKQLRNATSSSVKQKISSKVRTVRKLKKVIVTCPPPPGGDSGGSFNTVSQIIENRCMGCHATQGDWQNDEAWFINTGRVVPGDLAASNLYRYLAGNAEGLTPGTMPLGRNPLTATQIGLIREWILGIEIPPPSTFEFACNAPGTPVAAPLKRLSRQQFVNTFVDLLAPFSGSEQAAIYTQIRPALDVIPADSPRKTFIEERAFPGTDLAVNGQHVSAVYGAALAFANQVTSTSARRLTFSTGNCSFGSTGTGRTCLENFVTRFGLRAHRRAITSAERTAYVDYYLSRPSATSYRDLIVTMLMSPDFFYHREDSGIEFQAGGAAAVRLSSYELANKLSYLFWQSMPDTALFQAAADGSLATEAGYRAQVDRLFASPRTKQTMDQFFELLLGMDTLPLLNGLNSPEFNSFAAGLNIPSGDSELIAHMRQELVDMVDHYVWQTNQNFSDLFLSSHSFARDSKLASIYGVQPWSGSHTELVSFPSAQQSRGLLGRAAIQVTGSHQKSTVKLGARILREWNCTPLSDPPPDIMGQVIPPPYDPTKSTRQRYEDLTSPPACIGCHAQFNPIGFAMEKFDAIGRYREVERIFNAAGMQVAQIPIDSTVEFRSLPSVPRTVTHPIEVFQSMIDTGKAEACFAQQYFRFANRVHEDLAVNGCALQSLHNELRREGGTMQGMLKQIALSDDFKTRRLVP